MGFGLSLRLGLKRVMVPTLAALPGPFLKRNEHLEHQHTLPQGLKNGKTALILPQMLVLVSQLSLSYCYYSYFIGYCYYYYYSYHDLLLLVILLLLSLSYHHYSYSFVACHCYHYCTPQGCGPWGRCTGQDHGMDSSCVRRSCRESDAS